MINDFLQDAYAEANSIAEIAVKAVPRRPGNPIASIGGSPITLANQNMLVQHTEQYKHYVGWPYAIIRTIAQRIAGQPFRVGRRIREGNKFHKGMQPQQKRGLPTSFKDDSHNIELLADHPLVMLINKPNQIMVKWTFLFITIASMELTGKCHWWFFVDEQEGLQVWPLPSSWVQEHHSEERLYDYWELRPDGFAAPILIPGNQIVLLGYPDPANPLSHVSPLQAQARAVVADEFIQESQRRAFLNGLNPGLALIVGRLAAADGSATGPRPILDKAQRLQLITAVKQQYRGAVNHDEPLILDGLIEDAKRITRTPQEMDYLNSSNLSKNRLTQSWGVNPVSMGQLENANRASSATADSHFTDNVLIPKTTMLSEIITARVAPMFEDGLLAYIEAPHSDDPELDLKADMAMYDRGVMPANEWRSRRHLPPIENGDTCMVDGNMVERVVTVSTQLRQPSRQPRSFNKRLGQSGLKALFLKVQGERELQLASLLTEVLKDIGKEALTDLERHKPVMIPDMALMLPAQSWSLRIQQACLPQLKIAWIAGAVMEWQLAAPRKSNREIDLKSVPSSLQGVAFNLPTALQAFLTTWALQLTHQEFWHSLGETIRDDIQASLQISQRDSDTITQAAEKLQELLGPKGAYQRAMRIARTESSGALNSGQWALQQRLHGAGLLKGRTWLAIDDENTRDAHALAQGQTVGPEEDFVVGDEECSYPGDMRLSAANRCNCRCSVMSLLKD